MEPRGGPLKTTFLSLLVEIFDETFSKSTARCWSQHRTEMALGIGDRAADSSFIYVLVTIVIGSVNVRSN